MAAWTDAKILYFHFNNSHGGFASLPMVRRLCVFSYEFKGVPGTIENSTAFSSGATRWLVPGYKCLNCAKTFFAATQDGLKHECMGGNGGIVSDCKTMGV